MSLIQLITTLIPVLSVFILLVLCRLPAKHAMPLSLAATALGSFFVWQVPALHMLAATLEGVILALTILWIVFGAVLLLKVLQQTGATTTIKQKIPGSGLESCKVCTKQDLTPYMLHPITVYWFIPTPLLAWVYQPNALLTSNGSLFFNI
ncbi:L-lactate permease [Pseudoalteromonas xiamenensis]